jgi:capsular polysaccharide export protein
MTSLAKDPRRAASRRLPAPGVLQAPPFGRLRPRVSAPFATQPQGGIEQALFDASCLPDYERLRVRSAVNAIVRARVGGEFWAPALSRPLRGGAVLLRPKTLAGARAMVRHAMARTDAGALLASMPDRSWARRFGALLERKGGYVHLGPVDPWKLFDHAHRVEIEGNDPVGFIGLMLNRTVACTAACDLSGWGLTSDTAASSGREPRTFAELAHAFLISGVAYRNPFTGEAADCEEIVAILADWRRAIDRNRRIACCAGISAWKRKAVAAMLHTGERAPSFHGGALSAMAAAKKGNGAVAAWTSRAPKGLTATAAWSQTPLLHMEDGFLRSTGLGSDLTPPCSIVVDARAPHYAAGQVSDLEHMLAHRDFDAELLRRADLLIASITRLGLTKYNTGETGFELARGHRLVLVAGQVADDLSVLMGGTGPLDNLELLSSVRALEPTATILFKPHPDVEAGHRRGAIPDARALRYADQIVRGCSTARLLETVDAVHVQTSLTGFEALLRNREVVAHGQPFYAGWGLTRDIVPPARRTRRLSLQQLVAGALILYPLYLDPVSGLPCSPEILVARLAEASSRPSLLTRLRRVQGRMRRAGVFPWQEIHA